LSKFTARIASLTAFALIALPIATFGTQARAQASVQLSGLDLATASGQAIFAHRADRAADQVCGAKNPSIANPCKAAVVAELNEKLASVTSTTQFAAATGGHAQASVRFADLNLASSAGKSVFDRRVNVAADQVCRDERNLTIRAGCRLAVRAEATEKLAMIKSGVQYAAR
jgi:UrcA family protein